MSNSGRNTVFFDIETTGLSRAKDRIVELYMTRRGPTGEPVGEPFYALLDPGVPVGAEAEALHGYSNADLAGKPAFADVAQDVLAYIEGCDLAGYNILGFDLPFLYEEFMRSGVVWNVAAHRIVDSYFVWTKYEGRKLGDAVKRFLGEEMRDLHKAEVDTEYQVRVHYAQLEMFGIDHDGAVELTGAGGMLDVSRKFVKGEDGMPAYNFGKYKGRSVADVHASDPGYLRWLAEGSSMNTDTKAYARKFARLIESGQLVA